MSRSQLKNDLVLRAARREHTERTPVWLMRQAGRSDPAYRQLRDESALSLEETFRNADLAAEISLLPRRIGVDAIIFFQDILTPLAPMGAPFVFRPGPVLEEPIRTPADIDKLCLFDPASELPFVGKTLSLITKALAGDLPVLGFAGAPLTLAFFLIEGKSPGTEPLRTRNLMRSKPAAFHGLLDTLADMTAAYLLYQIESGADAVQLFESVADLITQEEYESFAHPYHEKIFAKITGQVPTVLFAKEQPNIELMASSGADVLSIGACIDVADAKKRVGDKVAIQGNIDNRVVAYESAARIEKEVRACVRAGGQNSHILNLNHGLLPDTPFESVCHLIETAKSAPVVAIKESTVAE